MGSIQISRTEYQDKVFACWLGKNIGGTLGAPFEGKKYVNDLQFYHPIPDGASPNDDLDLQIVWLKMLEDKGININLPDFAEHWVRYLSAYPWNEYGFCQRNLARGLMPPISGCFENYYVDEMGSPIRSEIWACIAPGDPQLAASMAWKDSVLDHAGGEGMYGEMFWSAVESAAFTVKDPMTLIRIGLSMIPVYSGISRVIREAVWCFENNLEWAEIRERIASMYGHFQPCNAVPNHGFIILGWLYGKDFGEKLCKAVNCGYDTDCTGATLGALLGIIGGTDSIPEEWKKPIGETIVLHKFTGKFNAPETVRELTERVRIIAERFVAEKSENVEFAEKTSFPENLLSLLFRNEKAIASLRRDIYSSVAVCSDFEIRFHYNGEPVMSPGIERIFGISVEKDNIPVDSEIDVKVPEGWTVSKTKKSAGYYDISIFAQQVENSNTISVALKLQGEEHNTEFTILGPGEAKGFPSGANVATCPDCGARKESCICSPENKTKSQG